MYHTAGMPITTNENQMRLQFAKSAPTWHNNNWRSNNWGTYLGLDFRVEEMVRLEYTHGLLRENNFQYPWVLFSAIGIKQRQMRYLLCGGRTRSADDLRA